MGDGAERANAAADEAARADAEVEDAGEDGHRDRLLAIACELDDLGLIDDGVPRSGDAPQHAHGEHADDSKSGRPQEHKRQRNAGNDPYGESPAMAAVEP